MAAEMGDQKNQASSLPSQAYYSLSQDFYRQDLGYYCLPWLQDLSEQNNRDFIRVNQADEVEFTPALRARILT